MDKIQLYNNLLGDIGNLMLVVFGFSVTLFTVLYSFILNKRELLIEYADRIKRGESDRDPLIMQKNSNATKFIHNLKRFNIHLILVIFVDLIAYLVCMFSKYIIQEKDCKGFVTLIVGILSLIIIIYVAGLLIFTVGNYFKNTKT